MTTKNTPATDTKKPTYVLTLLRKDAGKYGTRVGVTFETEKGNQRLVWNVIPSSLELQNGTLVLVSYSESSSADPAAETPE